MTKLNELYNIQILKKLKGKRWYYILFNCIRHQDKTKSTWCLMGIIWYILVRCDMRTQHTTKMKSESRISRSVIIVGLMHQFILLHGYHTTYFGKFTHLKSSTALSILWIQPIHHRTLVSHTMARFLALQGF